MQILQRGRAAPDFRFKAFDEALGLDQFDDRGIGRVRLGGAGMAEQRGERANLFRVTARSDQAPEGVSEAERLFHDDVNEIVRERTFLRKARVGGLAIVARDPDEVFGLALGDLDAYGQYRDLCAGSDAR